MQNSTAMFSNPPFAREMDHVLFVDNKTRVLVAPSIPPQHLLPARRIKKSSQGAEIATQRFTFSKEKPSESRFYCSTWERWSGPLQRRAPWRSMLQFILDVGFYRMQLQLCSPHLPQDVFEGQAVSLLQNLRRSLPYLVFWTRPLTLCAHAQHVNPC